MHSRYYLQILVLAFAVILGNGCDSTVEKDVVGIGGVEYRLSHLSEAKPVDLTGVEFVGGCSEDDKREIARCLGRIQIPKLLVRKVWLAWAELPIAARVSVDGKGYETYIYLTKGADNIWHVKGSFLMVSNTSGKGESTNH